MADVKAEFAGLTERAGTIGNANAKVTITEFGDLRCPICQTFDNDVVPQVISDIVRPGTAKLQYKTWPILGPNSVEAAKAAYAARQQNALWRYAALTYLNQGDENVEWFTPAVARALAKASASTSRASRRIAPAPPPRRRSHRSTTRRRASASRARRRSASPGPRARSRSTPTYGAIASGVQQVSGSSG